MGNKIPSSHPERLHYILKKYYDWKASSFTDGKTPYHFFWPLAYHQAPKAFLGKRQLAFHAKSITELRICPAAIRMLMLIDDWCNMLIFQLLSCFRALRSVAEMMVYFRNNHIRDADLRPGALVDLLFSSSQLATDTLWVLCSEKLV